ncbi:MAG TPA: bifunctional UDP-sugar hydrolase/5'-nucleotidase, partial [Bacteroidales bacterium]|nr:bifunctional UDP-sugar hydrolase/5'-nucleotidase [Bacteroidales bacterium]
MNLNILKYYLLSVLVILALSSCYTGQGKHIRIIATTDVHGSAFSLDLTSGQPNRYSMSKVSGYIKSSSDLDLLILDNGDNLQGHPSVYYYNFEDTVSDHLWARILSYIGYDAVTVGNHDIEAGHNVYDRIRSDYAMPMLAANAIDTKSGKSYFESCRIVKKGGLKIAVIGLITPGIPGWLPEALYEGIEFRDMVESAQTIMTEVMKLEPDLIIGLFHAGWDETYGANSEGSYLNENASLSVAGNVPGFDIVIIGHDHDNVIKYLVNVSGDSVLILDGGSHARMISVADVTVSGNGKDKKKDIVGNIIETAGLATDVEYDSVFNHDFNMVKGYVSRKIGYLHTALSTRDAYFGDSPFIDLLHQVQLETSGADISFAAPLSYDVTIASGEIKVYDMFELYRYENMLYTVELEGNEVDGYLEYSYSMWFNTMNNANDTLLKYEIVNGSPRLRNRYYNFDSASGI